MDFTYLAPPAIISRTPRRRDETAERPVDRSTTREGCRRLAAAVEFVIDCSSAGDHSFGGLILLRAFECGLRGWLMVGLMAGGYSF